MGEEVKEFKMVSFGLEGGKLKVSFDFNRDGEPVLDILVDIKEIPDEVIDLFKKEKDE